MKFNKISYQILVVFVAVVILSLGLSGWLVTSIAQNIVTDSIARGHRQLARRIAEEINAAMRDIEPVLELLAQSSVVQSMDAAAVEREITRYRESFPMMAQVYVADATGQQIARTDGERLENVARIFGFQVAEQGYELVSDIYFSPVTSEPMLTIYLPITADPSTGSGQRGKVVGVLCANINFESVQAIIADLELEGNETLVVVAENGRAVAHSRMDQLTESRDLSDLAVIEAVVSGQEGVMKGYTDELGRRVLGVHAPVEELGWGVVIQTPEGELADEVAALRRTMALGLLGGVALAVVAGWLMARRLAEPIGRLARATERVTAGDLDAAVEVSASNEVGVLANSFNRMVASLKESRAKIEQLYAEVKELNVGLEQRINLATEEIRQRADELATLYEVSRGLAVALDLETILPVIARRVTEALGADRCAVFLFDERAEVLRARAAHGYMAERLADFNYRPGEEIVGQAYATGETQYVPDLDLVLDLPRRDEIRAVLAIPLASPTAGPLGVLSVTSLRPEAFTPDQQRLLETMASQIAGAIQNARLYEAAQEADRLKSAFLATMSHELRTPLNSIIGFTGIIIQGLAGPLNDEQTKQLGMVQSSARHLLNLINDVLDISKIEAGQVEIVSEPFDMRQAIEKVMRTVSPLAEKKGLALVAAVAPEVGQIVSDRRRVEQILINLLNNAVKFTEQGEVRVECEVSDGWLVTRVVDTGIGIKPEDMGVLFEAFRQIDIGLTRRHEGTGLGLSICKKLVEMMGGEIWAESEGPGKGSTFTFTLPSGLSLRAAP